MVVDEADDAEDYGGNSQVFFYPIMKYVSLLLFVRACGWVDACA